MVALYDLTYFAITSHNLNGNNDKLEYNSLLYTMAKLVYIEIC